MIQGVLPISSDRQGWSNGGKNQNTQKSLDKKLTFEKTHAESLKT